MQGLSWRKGWVRLVWIRGMFFMEIGDDARASGGGIVALCIVVRPPLELRVLMDVRVYRDRV